MIGKTVLSDMLEGRDKISNLLQKIIDERTEPWGINVISVEVKDVLIPSALDIPVLAGREVAQPQEEASVLFIILVLGFLRVDASFAFAGLHAGSR